MNAALGPFGDCKNAALQHLGDVQANGVLVAVNSENNLIEYCSANSAELLGSTPTQLLGKTGDDGLKAEWPLLSALANGEGKVLHFSTRRNTKFAASKRIPSPPMLRVITCTLH